MVRVDGSDAAALGLEALELNFLPPADDKIDPDQVWEALGTIYDPEIPVDLVNLGLIYDTQIDQTAGVVTITMTLTAPTCGMGPVLVGDVENRVRKVPKDRKSTRLNSSHVAISYAVFCLKKKRTR